MNAAARYRRIALGVQAAAFVYSGLSLLRPPRMLVSTMLDDAAYYLTFARNFVAGYGWTFDRIHPSNGFQPLWQYLLVGLQRLAPLSPEGQMRLTSLVESVLLSLFGLMLWQLIDRRSGPRAGASATIFYVGLVYFPSRSGMETALYLFVVMVILRWVTGGNPWVSGSPRSSAGFGLVLGALMLTRLDSVFYVGALVLVLLLEGLRGVGETRRRVLLNCALAVLVATTVVAPYLAYNVVAFGHLMPISGAIKSAFPVPGWNYRYFMLTSAEVLFFLGSSLLGLLVLVWRFGPGRRNPSPFWRYGATALAIGVLTHETYSILFMKWGVSGWHFALGRILVTVLAPVLFEWVLQHAPPRLAEPAWALACLVVLIAGGLAIYRRDWGSTARNSWRVASYDAALWVREHLPADAVLAMKDSGYLGLISERRVVNLDGMVNSFDFQERVRRHEFRAYLRDSGVQYFAFYPPEKPYVTTKFYGWSHLYEVPGDSIELQEKDELYRSIVGDARGTPVSVAVVRLHLPGPEPPLR